MTAYKTYTTKTKLNFKTKISLLIKDATVLETHSRKT